MLGVSLIQKPIVAPVFSASYASAQSLVSSSKCVHGVPSVAEARGAVVIVCDLCPYEGVTVVRIGDTN